MAMTRARAVVIFGGAGFIGTHLAEEHVARGDDVVVADLRPSAVPGVRSVHMDVRQPVELDVPAPDVIYDLAAVHRTPGHEPHEYYETNIGGARNVSAWATAAEVPHVVFTSSISVYGARETKVDEGTPPQPDTDYGRSKLEAEQIHLAAAAAAGRRLTIARPAVVFGAGENGNFTRLAHNLRRGSFVLPGRDDTIKGAGYVKDLVRALYEPRSDLFNFAFPQLYTIREICDAFADVAGYRRPRMAPWVAVQGGLAIARKVPIGAVRTLAARTDKLLHSTAVVPQALIDDGFVWSYDMTSALKDWQTDEPDFV